MPSKRTPAFYSGIFFLILTLLLGCLFLMQAADIYLGAIEARAVARAETSAKAAEEGWDELVTKIQIAVAVKSIPIHSRQIVTARLTRLLPAVCVWLLALLGNIILRCKYPTPVTKLRHDPEALQAQKLRRQRERLPDAAKPGQEPIFEEALAAYRIFHRRTVLVAAGAGVGGFGLLLPPFFYFADAAHFPAEDITAEVVRAVRFSLPFVLAVLAMAIGYVFLRPQLLKAEAAALKAVIANGVPKEVSPAQKKLPVRQIVRICLLLIGLGLFVWGTQCGSMQEVLTKSTKICTECIGLG